MPACCSFRIVLSASVYHRDLRKSVHLYLLACLFACRSPSLPPKRSCFTSLGNFMPRCITFDFAALVYLPHSFQFTFRRLQTPLMPRPICRRNAAIDHQTRNSFSFFEAQPNPQQTMRNPSSLPFARLQKRMRQSPQSHFVLLLC